MNKYKIKAFKFSEKDLERLERIKSYCGVERDTDAVRIALKHCKFNKEEVKE